MHKFNTNNSFQKAFYFVFLLVIIDRLVLLFTYNFQYTGNDDVVFWQGALHYSNGFFHEPYMFGQNYNFMLESIIAVPFIKIGVPYYIIFPLISSFLCLFPFLFFGTLLFKYKLQYPAILFISIPLLLPIEFGILTSVSRGFVCGLFFLSFLVFPLLDSKKTSSIVLLSFSAGLGYILNPNTLIVILPVTVYVFLNNYKNFKFFLIFPFVTVSFYIVEYFAKTFYVSHKEYLVHEMWKLEWSFDKVIYSFSHLDKLFTGLTPILWIFPWLSLFFIFLCIILLFPKNKIYSFSLLSGFLFMIFMFGLNKVHDNMDTIFLSSARMFLTLPFLVGISIYWLLQYYPIHDSSKKLKLILGVFVLVFGLKITLNPSKLNKHIGNGDFGPVAIMKIDKLKQKCEEIFSVAEKEKVSLIVFSTGYDFKVTEMEFYNYGCSCLYNNKTPSILNKYERRFWVFEKYYNMPIKKLLIIGNVHIDQTETEILIKKVKKDYYIVYNNTIPLHILLKRLKSELIRF